MSQLQNEQGIEMINELKQFATKFPSSFFKICYLLVNIVKTCKDHHTYFDFKGIAEDLVSVFDSIGKYNPLKPYGSKASFSRIYVDLYKNRIGINVNKSDIDKLYNELSERYKMYEQVILGKDVHNDNADTWIEGKDGSLIVPNPRFYDIEKDPSRKEGMLVIYRWLDSLTKCADYPLGVEYMSINEECFEQHFYSHIHKIYIKLLYLIPMLINDCKSIHILKDNEEMKMIVENNKKKGFRYEHLYSVYKQYYPELFGKNLISNDDFCSVIETNNIMSEMDGLFDEEISIVKRIGLNPEEIIAEGIANCKEEKKIGEWLIDDCLNKGRFDSLMECMDHSMAKRCLVDLLTYYLLDSTDLDVFFEEVEQLIAFCQAETLYYEKYNLLHPAKIEASNDICSKLKNAKTGIDFENVLKDLYVLMGYDVETTKTTGDQGADLVVQKNGRRAVIQAKYYSSQVGNSAVQEVLGAIKYYNAQKGIVITNNTFTKGAIDLASANDIQLIDRNGLSAMISALV